MNPFLLFLVIAAAIVLSTFFRNQKERASRPRRTLESYDSPPPIDVPLATSRVRPPPLPVAVALRKKVIPPVTPRAVVRPSAAAPPTPAAPVVSVDSRPPSPVVKQLVNMLRSPQSVRFASVLHEVLGPPLSRRRR